MIIVAIEGFMFQKRIFLGLVIIINATSLTVAQDINMKKSNSEKIVTVLATMHSDAESGNAEAQYRLGVLYESPILGLNSLNYSVNRNATTVTVGEFYDITGINLNISGMTITNYFRQSSDQGYIPATYKLANRYINGLGVRQDYNKAMSLYKLAAETNYAEAQNKLGKIYDSKAINTGAKDYNVFANTFNRGTMVYSYNEPSLDNKEKWLKPILGKVYGSKEGDLIALEWYGKACDNGNDDGCYRYKELKKILEN